ncbi:MAG: molybdopterin-guanine dinucleotide biosynthesis protein MobB [Lachnospiraceae bacterium]|nr:molybdopterin-guanine dinucleotide biosynthesis protein MobB [Lachnospiraceae bacterium]
MIKADLITGFLGSGKTTFLKHYVSFLLKRGLKVGIIVNDHGAINVDMLILDELNSDKCDTEMVIATDRECHMRRFKTKLIAMYMQGFDRVVVEPSGIFDVDEFFDIMHDDTIEKMYQTGNVISVVDAGLPEQLSPESEYMLATQVAVAGKIFVSHMDEYENELENTVSHLNRSLSLIGINEDIRERLFAKAYDKCTESDFESLCAAEYHPASYEKRYFEGEGDFDCLFFMNQSYSPEEIRDICGKLFSGDPYGNVIRVKGFISGSDGKFLAVNATRKKTIMEESAVGQDVIIVIGERLDKNSIEKIFS